MSHPRLNTRSPATDRHAAEDRQQDDNFAQQPDSTTESANQRQSESEVRPEQDWEEDAQPRAKPAPRQTRPDADWEEEEETPPAPKAAAPQRKPKTPPPLRGEDEDEEWEEQQPRRFKAKTPPPQWEDEEDDAPPQPKVLTRKKKAAPPQWEDEDAPPPPKAPARKKKTPPLREQWEDEEEGQEEAEWEEPQNTAAQQPKQPTQPPAAHYGALNGLFNGLAAIGPIALLLLLGCMAWPMFWQPGAGVFCPAEIKWLSGFLHCLAQQSWLAPTGLENGAFSLPLWPAFSWWIGLFAWAPQLVQAGLLLPTATFAATFLAACGVWTLAITAGFGRKAALAGSVILICSPIFAPLPHFVGPAALAAAFMLFALSFFCRGWMAQHAWISLPLAFAFTALAGLAGGPLPFAVPLLASLFFLIWRATFSRAQRLDAIAGFFLMLVIIGVWIGALMLGDGHEAYFAKLMSDSVRYAWPVPYIWLIAAILGLVGLLPWILTILGVSWFRVIGRSAKTLGASRHGNGSALCWLALIFALCASPFISAFHTAAIAIACLGATLLGKAFINLGSLGNRFFFAIAAMLILLAGAVICLATYPDTQPLLFEQLPLLANFPDLGKKLLSLPTLPIMGYICIAAGILGLFFVKRSRGSGGLVFAAIVVIALCQPARLMLVPEITAMPGTPLVNYASVEKQVAAALAPSPAEPAPEAQTVAPVPAQQAPASDQAATPEQSAEQPSVAPTTEPSPAGAQTANTQPAPAPEITTSSEQTATQTTAPAAVPDAAATQQSAETPQTPEAVTPPDAEHPATQPETGAQSANTDTQPTGATEEVIIVEEVKEQPGQAENSISKTEPASEKTDKK